MSDHRDQRAIRPPPGHSAPQAPALDFRLHSLFRTASERIFVVHGAVEAEIRYEAFGWGERVQINGEIAAQTAGIRVWSLQLVTVAPWIVFEVNAGGRRAPARVDVSIYWAFWKGIKDFRLQIAGQVLYAERNRQIVFPENLESLKTWVGS